MAGIAQILAWGEVVLPITGPIDTKRTKRTERLVEKGCCGGYGRQCHACFVVQTIFQISKGASPSRALLRTPESLV